MSVVSASGFFKSGVTGLTLKMLGKTPSESNKFASLAISEPRTSALLLRMLVGMKLSEDDLGGKFWMARTTNVVKPVEVDWCSLDDVYRRWEFSGCDDDQNFSSNRCKLVGEEHAEPVTDVLVNHSI